VTEDEKTAALAWAKLAFEAWLVSGASVMSAKANSARALLDAVRLILEPFEGECRFCLFPVPHHAEDCPALPWVLAAERAGL